MEKLSKKTEMFSKIQNQYVHMEKESFRSKLLKKVLILLGFKKSIENKITKNKYISASADIPKYFQGKFEVKKSTLLGRNLWEIKPKRPSKKVICYLHGGAYINPIRTQHWDLVGELVERANTTVVMPDYPLAPKVTYKEVHDHIDAVYNEILKEHLSENIVFMGDSAGGGLALAFAMSLRNEGRPQPSQLILLSPWVDVTMTNPAIQEVNKYDKILGIRGTKMAGKLYADDASLTDYRISPIYGNFENMPPISTFIGTHDILIADNQKMKDILEKSGNLYHYFEYPKMVHVWTAVVKLPEAQKSIEQMVELINNQ